MAHLEQSEVITALMEDGMDDDVRQRQRERFELLSVLYDLSPGSAGVTHSYALVRSRITFEKQRGWEHTSYLHREGLLRMGNEWLEITHAGLKEVERARERPGLATEHFEPAVIYHFHGPVGAVQTGPGATAQVVQN
jgi:hypothetical protein